VAEEILERMMRAEVQPDARELADDDRADFDELEPDRVTGGFGQFHAGDFLRLLSPATQRRRILQKIAFVSPVV
jgi:hypothetical protein